MEKIRLQKILSEAGVCSRRAAEQLIAEGRVAVNGVPATLGQRAGENDRVTVDGAEITRPAQEQKVYLMLHKPRGYVTTASDEYGRRCVTDLTADVGTRVYPVGRLDKNSEGLLFLTNDGEFANLLTHPSHEVQKVYRVTIEGAFPPEAELGLMEGVRSDGELLTVHGFSVLEAAPERTVLQIVLTQGKNRHIRRMCEALGLQVARLKRVSEGGVKLGMLGVGKWRMLTEEEVAALYKAAGRPAHRTETVRKGKNHDRTETGIRRKTGGAGRRV